MKGWNINPQSWQEITDKPPALVDDVIDWSEIQNRPTMEELRPDHQWIGESLQFETAAGIWGSLVNLKGDQGVTGAKGDKGDQGIQGEPGDPGDLIISPAPVTDISTADYPLGAYCFGGASSGSGNPFVFQTIFGFNQSIARHAQFSAQATSGSLKFRTAHTSFASGWSDWAELFNSRNLNLGSENHFVYGSMFIGIVGEYRFSDSLFSRYFISFNAYASSSFSSGYRAKNPGYGAWLEQLTNGNIRFSVSSGSASLSGEGFVARSIFEYDWLTQKFTFRQKLNFQNLPTSATGLTAGDVWKDSNGFLRIV